MSCLSESKPQSTTDGKCCAASCLPVWLCLSRLRKAQVAREQATCGVPWAWLATVYVGLRIDRELLEQQPAGCTPPATARLRRPCHRAERACQRRAQTCAHLITNPSKVCRCLSARCLRGRDRSAWVVKGHNFFV